MEPCDAVEDEIEELYGSGRTVTSSPPKLNDAIDKAVFSEDAMETVTPISTQTDHEAQTADSHSAEDSKSKTNDATATIMKEIGTISNAGNALSTSSQPPESRSAEDGAAVDHVAPASQDTAMQDTDQAEKRSMNDIYSNGDAAMHEIEQARNPSADAAPEWEVDSSPYQSSSDSSDSSSSDSGSDDDDYELLDPAEQARRLMEDDGGSDDEGGHKGSAGGRIRSHNEQVDEPVDKPDIVITPEMGITELGRVEKVVENVALIKANTSGEYQVLEVQSLLCLADRKVIGVVSETLGRVQEPLYCIRFTNQSSMEQDGVTLGTIVYYVPSHSTFVFTKALQAVKGSDASNDHDEEVGDNEMEFSDDEAEAEYKRRLKQQRRERHGDKERPNKKTAAPRKGHQDEHLNYSNTLNYDDDTAQEDLYTPLARPANFHEVPASNMVEDPDKASGGGYRGSRGRGDRGRGRGRGFRGGRGGFSGLDQRPQHALPDKPNVAVPTTHGNPYPSPVGSGPTPGFAQGQPQPYQFQFQGQMQQHQHAHAYQHQGQQFPPVFQNPPPQQNYGAVTAANYWSSAPQQYYPQQVQQAPQGGVYPFQQMPGQYNPNMPATNGSPNSSHYPPSYQQRPPGAQ